MARAVLLMADDPRRAALLPPGTAEATEALLRTAGLLPDWQRRLQRSPRARTMLAWSERKLLPGQTTYIALRKRLVDDETRSAIAAGANQVLVVGGGFDTLAMRLAPVHPRVRFVEIDHPASQSLKQHALQQLGTVPNLRLHPADLAEMPLPDVLDELDWDRGARSVAITEGALTHLEGGDVADFMRGVASVTSPGSRLLASHRVPDELGRPAGGRVGELTRWSLDKMGEPHRWAASPEAVETLLADAGFSVRPQPGRTDLRLRYLVPAGLDDLPLATVERLVVAERE